MYLHFRWNVGLPTQAHFSAYYLTHATDGIPAQGDDIEKVKTYLDKYVSYFLEISLQGRFLVLIGVCKKTGNIFSCYAMFDY